MMSPSYTSFRPLKVPERVGVKSVTLRHPHKFKEGIWMKFNVLIEHVKLYSRKFREPVLLSDETPTSAT